jgi:alpha-glucosidase
VAVQHAGNHDSPRVLSRYADSKNDEALARLSLALMLTLRGTPFLYNGEEIGMADYLLSDATRFRDLWGQWVYRTLVNVIGVAPAEATREAAQRGRDKCRTPMHWANAAHAGFCPPDVEPWLPVHPNYAQGVNVAEQETQPDSLLNFYRRLLRVRRETPALLTGDYKPLLPRARACFVFARRTAQQRCLVALNFSARPQKLNLTGLGKRVHCLYSSHPRPSDSDDPRALSLAPFEIYLAAY